MLFRQDRHLHLYGCLTAKDVWQIGRDRYLQRQPLMSWYATEYLKAWGRKPDYLQYWQSSQGLSLLKRDFEFKESGTFAQFQACFNLAIAAVGLSPEDTTVLRAAAENLQAWGVDYAELRTVLPLRLTLPETQTYLRTLCTEVTRIKENTGLVVKLVISLDRGYPVYEEQYRRLKEWKSANPSLGACLVGIDFCGDEEDQPPSEKARFLGGVHRDNAERPDEALRIYYHVGETFQKIGLASSIRWVFEAHQLGVQRLGHATSVAISPWALLSQRVEEPIREAYAQGRWLLANYETLKAFGFNRSLAEVKAERARLEDALGSNPDGTRTTLYSPEFCEELENLQGAVRGYLKENGAVIESCPTSNLRLSPVKDLRHHPLHAFAKDNFPVCIASDDPGIFATNLSEEIRFCREQLQISESYLNAEV